ncbi:MAG: hypothetical protein M1130_06645 [Actinobacteria bacterium]|nr:hypothetical protein [Actinomycetota bacterium]
MMGWYGGGMMGFLGPIVMVLGLAAFYIVFLVAAWRLMRAHESLAETLKEVAQSLRSKT